MSLFTKSAAICATALTTAVTAQTEKPNIIMIMADDVGYECFGFSGSKQYKTPNLDKLAEQGVVFTHAYSNPLCTPTRNKIMTGQSNIRNYSAFRVLNEEEKTFGHVMSDAGYETCIAGKWQLYGHYNKSHYLNKIGMHPEKSGFDEYYLWQVESLGGRFWSPLLNLNGETKQFGDDVYGPDVLFSKVTDFIDRKKDKPFFIYYPMILVHDPFVPTPHSKDKSCKDNQKNFEDMMEYMDFLIGKLMTNLEKNGVADNTLIMFTGDNGTNVKIYSELNGKTIRGGKGKMTDAGTRVAFVAHWPKSGAKGKVCSDVIDFSDILPTIADAGSTAIPEGTVMDGQSFLPSIKGEKSDHDNIAYVSYFKGNSKEAAVYARDERYKLYADGKFFDIQNDVMEEMPLDAEKLSEVQKAIKIKLQKKITEMPQKGLKIHKYDKKAEEYKKMKAQGKGKGKNKKKGKK